MCLAGQKADLACSRRAAYSLLAVAVTLVAHHDVHATSCTRRGDPPPPPPPARAGTSCCLLSWKGFSCLQSSRLRNGVCRMKKDLHPEYFEEAKVLDTL